MLGLPFISVLIAAELAWSYISYMYMHVHVYTASYMYIHVFTFIHSCRLTMSFVKSGIAMLLP